ncbi:efflux RND transporter periplasmic adaptor subunit [Thalassotalea ganghwensis]
MDTRRQIQPTPIWKKYWWLLPISLVIFALYALNATFGNASYIVDKNELVTAVVEQGEFSVNVRATGVLKPLTERWMSSEVSGRVELVNVKPGARVSQGEILAQLSNPQLHRDLEKASWELKAFKAESHAALVQLESQMLDLENSIVAAEFNYQSAKLKLDAETQLMEQGNATVSALDYQKSQLLVKQQMQSWQAQKEKAKKMRANIDATKQAQQARLGLVENNYQRIVEQVNALSVRSTVSGIVQQVSLKLGERAQVGDSVALVADQQALYAQLQVQEVRARDIALGQQVIIDTRTHEYNAHVTRIDPAVSSGMVLVDVEFTEPLPSDMRPELTVDGLIQINHIDNALFVKRPMFAPKHTRIDLFQLSQNQQFANKRSVDLGVSSVDKIQILSGLAVGDTIIISDTSDWQDHKQILIN